MRRDDSRAGHNRSARIVDQAEECGRRDLRIQPSVGASMRKAASRGTNVKVVRMLDPPRERVTLKENS